MMQAANHLIPYLCIVTKLGNIEIRVFGELNGQELHPNNYDIKHIAKLMHDIEDLLYPNAGKERPLISYEIGEGSVKHFFKTSLQTIVGFSAVLSQINSTGSIDFLEPKSARAIENIQKVSIQEGYEFQIKTSVQEAYELKISPTTQFTRSENIWIDVEYYFYGELKNAGGKSKANIHIQTEDFGYVTIETGEDFLKKQEENLLYKKLGIRAKGKQNVNTGEMDEKSLRLIEIIDYQPSFDEGYLNKLISNAKSSWKGVDPNEWLKNVRGNYEA